MKSELKQVLESCQNTGSWFGIRINSVADRNDFEDTPLHTVCSWGDIESAKVLLDAGADINAKGDHGATPIFNGVVSGDLELVKFLLKRGASKGFKIFGTTTLIDYAKNIGTSKEILSLLK
jgi:ankyrin repeat protein